MPTENELLKRITELIHREFERFAANHPGQQLLYTRVQASNLLGISLSSLQILIARGDIGIHRIAKRVLISHEELVRVSKIDFDTLWPKKGPNGTRRQIESPKP